MSDPGVGLGGHREQLRDLVSRPHLVDVLDVLSTGPMTLPQMGAVLPRGRRGIARALHDLVLRGLVTGEPGSRDHVAAAHERYRCTARGQTIVALLSKYSVWAALHDPW
ncbi:hypothetical protein BayCH28_12940 [Mycolicibacterium sp. CH28]|uniref:hypothetical protein n=1 Tax=Mycolicibacterium sp. CH28 TaxID=2512237 RepID=UPI0010813825|nr:hypothetical protein [Mycolicibacterium sp. CH28]TGD87294.1 hypothetical protein BayCH28_12940 [Mycolicibacterium sp. CH28]